MPGFNIALLNYQRVLELFLFVHSFGNNAPNWRTHMFSYVFFEGFETTSQLVGGTSGRGPCDPFHLCSDEDA